VFCTAYSQSSLLPVGEAVLGEAVVAEIGAAVVGAMTGVVVGLAVVRTPLLQVLVEVLYVPPEVQLPQRLKVALYLPVVHFAQSSNAEFQV
jgi:hypothetical protein